VPGLPSNVIGEEIAQDSETVVRDLELLAEEPSEEADEFRI